MKNEKTFLSNGGKYICYLKTIKIHRIATLLCSPEKIIVKIIIFFCFQCIPNRTNNHCVISTPGANAHDDRRAIVAHSTGHSQLNLRGH